MKKSAQTVGAGVRTPVFCPRTHKLLLRVDGAALGVLAGIPGGLWAWCRDCHMEHHLLWKTIAANEGERREPPGGSPIEDPASRLDASA